MKNMVYLLALMFSTSIFFVSTVRAETDIYARTTADKLNVRSIANGKIVIERLPRGSVVAILEKQGTWANILYLENNDTNRTKEGWVSVEYLHVIYKKKVYDHLVKKIAGIQR